MYKLTPLALLIALMLCGFGPSGEGKEPEPEPEAEEDSNVMDSSDMTIDMYIDGTIKASYWITVHADPKAGQYWQTEMEAYGTKSTTRWQVASVDGDTAIIENQMKSSGEYAKSDYVLAYKIDLKAAMGDVNVTKAWIGKPGKEAKEIKVMEKPEPMADGGAAGDYKMVTEDFNNLEIAGGKWSGKLTTITGDGWESKMWVADNGWFGGAVKMESAGMVNELKAFGEDAKALLKMPKDEKEAEKKEDKEGEKTPDKDK